MKQDPSDILSHASSNQEHGMKRSHSSQAAEPDAPWLDPAKQPHNHAC